MIVESIVRDQSCLDNTNLFVKLIPKGLVEIESIELVLDELIKYNLLSKLIPASAWVCFGTYIPDMFCDVAKRMIKSNLINIKEYMLGYITLNDLGKKICIDGIRYLSNLDKNKTISDLRIGNNIINEDLNWKISKSLHRKNKINILGFGSGDCSDLILLKNFLHNINSYQSIALFCYDPYNTPHILNDVTYINDPANNRGVEYDLMISRWVLHHVEESLRWNDFLVLANNVAKNGEIYILEEGDLVAINNSFFTKRLYYLFLLLVDIVINSVLYPNWLHGDGGKNFFIKYINRYDLMEIEKGFEFPFYKSLGRFGSGNFFSQVFCLYKRLE